MIKSIKIAKFIKNTKTQTSSTISKEYLEETGKNISLLVKKNVLDLNKLMDDSIYRDYYIRFTNNGIADCFFLMKKNRNKASKVLITGQMIYTAKDLSTLTHLALAGSSYDGITQYPCLSITFMPFWYEQIKSSTEEEKLSFYEDLDKLTDNLIMFFLYSHVQDKNFLTTKENDLPKITINKFSKKNFSLVSINTCPSYLISFVKDLHKDRNTFSLYEITRIPRLLNFFVTIDEKEKNVDHLRIWEKTPKNKNELLYIDIYYTREKIKESTYIHKGRIRRLPFVLVQHLEDYAVYNDLSNGKFPYNGLVDFVVNLFSFYLCLKNHQRKSTVSKSDIHKN